MRIIFFLSIGIIFYSYFLYPVIILALSFGSKKLDSCDEEPLTYPKLSVVIAAKNEENNIGVKVKNLLCQGYPLDRMEIIVVCDGSEDNTWDILEELKSELKNTNNGKQSVLKTFSYSDRRGKPYALNLGVAEATAEVIVFADARQQFGENALAELARSLTSNEIGCVSGNLDIEERGKSSVYGAMKTYWDFEKVIRKHESKSGSIPGATGAIYAIRKSLYKPLPENILLDDVLTPMNICRQGYRVILNSKARAIDVGSKSVGQEKKRKIRTLAGNWQLMFLEPWLLSPFKNPLWFRFVSHKILRLFAPFAFVLLLIAWINLKDWFSILIAECLAACIVLSVIPIPDSAPWFVRSVIRSSRSLVLLNYFALLSPFYLIAKGSKRIW